VQAENGADGYHVAATHWNYAATTARRSTGESVTDTRAMDAGSYGKTRGGFYAFDHGHVLLWTTRSNPEDEPLYERRQELVDQSGEAKANWMINVARNLCIYPNVYLMDQFSSQIRQYRPIAVDQTEVTIHCIAPKGESADARAARIRRYEDFFNATGMATPDDLEEFRSSQRGFMARNAPWNDMSRGATHWITGPDEDAKALGINPVLSGVRVEDEGLYPVQHSYWKRAMQHAVELEAKATGR
jgi:benzoate/toluate 1,2-dioxygenase alpha subunit